MNSAENASATNAREKNPSTTSQAPQRRVRCCEEPRTLALMYEQIATDAKPPISPEMTLVFMANAAGRRNEDTIQLSETRRTRSCVGSQSALAQDRQAVFSRCLNMPGR